MINKIETDLAIIGGGAGGLSVAAGAAQLGARVVLVESGKMGGDCLNYGCVPSKSLLAAAKAYYHSNHAKHFGVSPPQQPVHFQQVMQHVKTVINTIAVHDSVERFELLGVNVIADTGKFLDATTVIAGDNHIRAKRFVIATGSMPFIPPIPGLAEVPYLTNETIFDLADQPEHLIVIGGGPIGCEIAQAFAMLGSQVTIIDNATLLPKDDPDCVAIIKAQFDQIGIGYFEQVRIKQVTSSEQRTSVVLDVKGQTQTLSGSHLFVATGRRPNVTALNLKAAGITYDEKGIQVDSRLRTSAKKIYAIGDVIGGYQFTHVANYHAGIIIKNALFRLPAKINYRAVPWVTYTDPEIAHVGLTQKDVENDPQVKIIESLFSENDRAQAEHITQGKIKIMTDQKARILGVTIVGEHAGELILPWVMAIREKKTLRSFTDVIVPYPTLSEISKRVAGAFYTPSLFSERTRRLVRFLLWLG